MFDTGFFEWFALGIVVLVVLGPERLPEAARFLGRCTRMVRRWTASAKQHWNLEWDEDEKNALLQAKQEIQDLQNELHHKQQQLQQNFTQPIHQYYQNLSDMRLDLMKQVDETEEAYQNRVSSPEFQALMKRHLDESSS